MKIAVCDDERAQTEYLSGLIGKWSAARRIPAAVETFASAEAFRFAWSADQSCDVLLLDIQMDGQNGMALARDIRKSDSRMEIIFVTGFSDYIGEGYEVSALHYLIKPVKEDKLFSCLDRACSRGKAGRRTILMETEDGTLRLYQDEILYVESFAHSSAIVTERQKFEVGRSIGELEKELDPSAFFRPHRSYLIGLRHTQKIERDAVMLDGGVRIPLSRRKYGDANRAFIRFYRGKE